MKGMQQGKVSGGEVVVGELIPSDPGQFGVFESLRWCGCWGESADKGRHENLNPGVGVRDFGQSEKDVHLAAEFFLEFPMERLLSTFTRVDFAPWKFPQASEVFAGRSAGDEQFRLGRVPDEGADDGDVGHGEGEVISIQ